MIAALLMLSQMAATPAEPKPVTTTIAAIRSDPRKFDGRMVRLHGYVNHCILNGCSISERQAGDPNGPGQSLSIGPDQKFDQTIKPLIPTYVEFDARVDAGCLVQVCIGRPPVLTVVTLRGVVSPEPPPIEN